MARSPAGMRIRFRIHASVSNGGHWYCQKRWQARRFRSSTYWAGGFSVTQKRMPCFSAGPGVVRACSSAGGGGG